MSKADEQPTIDLNGIATRELQNDVLTLTFQKMEMGKDANGVQEILRQAVKDALAVIAPFVKPGEVDVETEAFQVSPSYEYKNGGKQKLVGYEGVAGIKVKGTDTATISGLASKIDSMMVASSSNSLSRKAREQVEAELTKEAIADFRKKADDAILSFGLNSWKLNTVSIRVSSSSPRGSGGKVMALSASTGMESTSMSVEGGKSEISVHVIGSVIPS